MFPSLTIRGFRTFPELSILQLGGVNLVVGRNNVGKTYLLEALQLFGSLGSSSVIEQQLAARNELMEVSQITGSRQRERRYRVESLFHGRKIAAGRENGFRLGVVGDDTEYLEIFVGDDTTPELDNPDQQQVKPFLGAHAASQGISVQSKIALSHFAPGRLRAQNEGSLSGPVLLPAGQIKSEEFFRWWDDLVVRGQEHHVLAALRVVEPVERIHLVAHPGKGGRMAVVNLPGRKMPVSLASLGDGMTRLFQLGVSIGLVTALAEERDSPPPTGGLSTPQCPNERALLIDEIENGLHYTVLPKVWEMLFALAEQVNAQIVATTHSWDCVQAFAEVAAGTAGSDATLVRLVRQQQRIRALTFTGHELSMVQKDKIEVR